MADNGELRTEEPKRRDRATVAADSSQVKIPVLMFKTYSQFLGADDRSKEENARFAGRFFQFSSMGANFDVEITDNELWSRPPAVDQFLWVTGRLVTNARLRISLQAKSLFLPNEKNPAPSLMELGSGTEWQGIGRLIRSSFTHAGETTYNLRVMSGGFLYTYRVDRDFYEQLPDDCMAKIQGVVTPSDIYASEYQGRRLGYTLDITRWEQINK